MLCRRYYWRASFPASSYRGLVRCAAASLREQLPRSGNNTWLDTYGERRQQAIIHNIAVSPVGEKKVTHAAWS